MKHLPMSSSSCALTWPEPPDAASDEESESSEVDSTTLAYAESNSYWLPLVGNSDSLFAPSTSSATFLLVLTVSVSISLVVNSAAPAAYADYLLSA